MGRLNYVAITSLDGYIGRDKYDWSDPPTTEATMFLTDVIRPMKTFLYGRKTYETMVVWEKPDMMPGLSDANKEFARVWQAADKIVYSRTLTTVSSQKTRIENEFTPEALRKLKSQTPHDLSLGGPEISSHAIRMGLVDEYHLFVVPNIIGGGIPIMPRDVQVSLELLDERRFGAGWMYLRYKARA